MEVLDIIRIINSIEGLTSEERTSLRARIIADIITDKTIIQTYSIEDINKYVKIQLKEMEPINSG